LKEAHDDDIVLISDVDEIISPDAIQIFDPAHNDVAMLW
jgi:hypothetical protein